ncbi:MAG TPA: universal stress protein [Candidatus Methylomirabilis sp.]|nr:universal stress protein [Candidatus Methylomirabilis sp.]
MTMRVLAAVDESEASREAVRFGAILTKALGGRLTLVHVRSRSEESTDAQALLRSARADAAKWGAETATGRVEVGAPVDAILRVARKIGTDMLIVGTHGRAGVARLFLGSVAEALTKRAPWPVGVVRKLEDSPAGTGPLLAPTDFSEGASHAIRAAALLARRLGTRLVLLHVLPEAVADKGDDDPKAVQRATLALRRDAESKLHSVIETLGLESGQVNSSLVTGVDAVGIVHVARAIHAGCIVMGTRGLTGLPRALLGSVTDQVLRHAPCPVVVVPPGVGRKGGWWRQARGSKKGS